MRAIVTGGTGFVGRHLVHALSAAGAEVISLVRSRSGATVAPRVRAIEVDLGNAAAVDAIDLSAADVLLHLASWTPKQTGPQDVDAIVQSNVLGTDQLLRAVARRVQRVVFASSLDVYGPLEGPVNDATPTQPATIYGAAKLLTESVVRQRAKEAGISACVLRLGHIYGPGESAYRKLVPVTIERVVQGFRPSTQGDGLERRDLLYVEDAVSAIQTAATSLVSGPFNLVSGTSYTVREIIGTIEELAGATERAEFAPSRTGKAPALEFDTAPIRRVLGDYARTSLRDGLAREISSVRAELGRSAPQ